MYAGCVSGAIQKEVYLQTITQTGFANVVVQKQKPIEIPEEMVKQYVSEQEWNEIKEKGLNIYSITVSAEKPCCQKETDCC